MKNSDFILFLVLSCSSTAWSQNGQCQILFSDSKLTVTEQANNDIELKDLVKAKDPSKTIRSSAGHFWRITKDIILRKKSSSLNRKQIEILEDLMKVDSWVIGDLHNGNLGPIRVAVTENDPYGKVDYAVVDYDDPAPNGALIFDIAHHIIAAKAVETPIDVKISKQEIFDAYLLGLKGKPSVIPARIEKILALDPREFRALEIKKASKFTAEDGKSLIKDNVKSSEVSAEESKEVTEKITQAIGDQYEVVDVGGREKETGGSAGALRYLVLLKEKSSGDQFLFELKEEAISAVEEFQNQPNYSYNHRIDHYVNASHPKDIRYRSLKIRNQDKMVGMTLRPKPLYFFDYANDGAKNKAYHEFKDLTLYNAYWLGKKQRSGDSSNALKLLEKIKDLGEDKVYDALKELTLELNQFYSEQSREFRKKKIKNKL